MRLPGSCRMQESVFLNSLGFLFYVNPTTTRCELHRKILAKRIKSATTTKKQKQGLAVLRNGMKTFWFHRKLFFKLCTAGGRRVSVVVS